MEQLRSRLSLNSNHYLALAFVSIVILSWAGLLDIASAEYIDGAIVQALAAFGGARALNAAISVVQSTNISVVIATVGIGEILDPLNDMVEQYSALMKYAIASLLVQKLLLAITGNVVFKILLTLVAAAAIGAAFLSDKKYLTYTIKTFVFLGFLRFALVLVVILNGLVNQAFLNKSIDEEISQIEAAAQQVQGISEEQLIAPELKAELEARLEALDHERIRLSADRDSLSEEFAERSHDLEKAEAELAEVEAQLGLTERMNIFNRDESHAEAIERRKLIEQDVATLKDRLTSLDETLAENEEAQTATRNTLAGKANSWMEAVGNATSGIASGVKDKFTGQIDALLEKLNDSLTNMLNLMAAFLLKTLILPLIFLYLIVLLTKVIWNVDLRQIKVARNTERTNRAEITPV